ncbi:MAG: Gfo/Idh/MocA family oxidoreductase [Candidatus Latescibacteria bacterium]|jgi:predicted dehydrogenase|nr:Gfo/Idh/MocA family oxidoreductase [Candidatus Latescibacterota bacterium]
MAAQGKRIGFVDYNVDNFHANTYLRLMREDLEGRGYTVAGCTGTRAKASQAWAEENGVPYFKNAEKLNEAVDFYMVLAPSNPEVHLELCRSIFRYGKATYVDKTFAPDLRTAKQIFALADRHRVPMQTTSALRYTNVQDYVREVGARNVRHMVTWAGGGSFGEYAIHPLEMAISCMGSAVKRLMRRGTGKQSQLLLDFTGGRTAVVNVFTKSSTPYSGSVTTLEATKYLPVEARTMFRDTAAAVLDMFESGRANIDRKESLMIRRILDVAGQKRALKGFVAV